MKVEFWITRTMAIAVCAQNHKAIAYISEEECPLCDLKEQYQDLVEVLDKHRRQRFHPMNRPKPIDCFGKNRMIRPQV